MKTENPASDDAGLFIFVRTELCGLLQFSSFLKILFKLKLE